VRAASSSTRPHVWRLNANFGSLYDQIGAQRVRRVSYYANLAPRRALILTAAAAFYAAIIVASLRTSS
jgi:hypothetical protein